ncbi:MAG: protein kinase [Acidobacteria bacterium]|nr:protein kinase [Acidobacteriota bacterium]
MIGKTLSHYRVVEKIGAGGMGEVYRARDEHLGRDVALKVLPAGTLGDEHARKRFRKEALALSKLNHPNIATVFDFDTQDGTDFLVMELVEGVTLSDKLAGGPLPEKEITRLGMQLAEALEEAHERGVVHRDLKPGNVMVTPKGQAKILDFGLAKLLRPVSETATTESFTETQGVAGTLPYMAPEQLRGLAPDHRSDIYSFGVVLYEMATGQRPFQERLATALANDIINKPPPPPGRLKPDLSSRLEEVILKCLEKEPEHRYQSAREVLADFRRLGAAPIAVSSARSVVRRWVLAVVALLVLVGGAVGISVWRQQRVAPPTSAVAAKPSLAVLPFENLSPDPENEYFSDGMTEEITSKLSRIQNLQVAARTSAARFKGSDKDIKEIGTELGVRYVLEGSVRKAGNRVRITAQLIDTASGFNLWAEDFEGELKDVFAVQEETALKIAEALNLRLSPQEQQAVQRRYTDNPEAYDAYLRGQALVEYFSIPEKLEAARRHFEQALQLDPDYALALAGLATVDAEYNRNIDPDPARLQRAEELAQRALTLEPQLARAHIALGQVYGNRYDYVRAAEQMREATQLEPDNPYAWDFLSWALGYQQPPDARGAEEAAREALRLQPNFPGAYYHLGRALLHRQRYEEAIGAFKHSLELSPDFNTGSYGLAQVYLAQEAYDRALAEWNKSGGLRKSAIGFALLGSIYAAQGKKENALAELKKALAAGYRDFAYLDASPYFDSLRSDPRFQSLLRRMNFPE